MSSRPHSVHASEQTKRQASARKRSRTHASAHASGHVPGHVPGHTADQNSGQASSPPPSHDASEAPTQSPAQPSPQSAQNSSSAQDAVRRESTLELAATLYTMEQLAQISHDAPQLAMAGRSNVGKSSLINALAHRRQLAKVSSTPGKTRSVNLFLVQPEAFYITDLPGYGYARRGKEERRLWGTLIENYLIKTPQLKAVVLLLDCRLPVQEADRLMVNFAIAHGLHLLPILTKSDKCNQRERAARQREWSIHLRGAMALPVSARTGLGLNTLWDLLRQTAQA